MKKRYWLRGMIWFECVWLGLWLFWALLGIFSGHADELFSNANSSYYHDSISAFLSVSVIAVVAGAIIGWVYGKMKKPSQDQTNGRPMEAKIANKRYWLRGGVVGVILFVLFAFLVLSSARFPFTGSGGELSGPPNLGWALLIGYVIVSSPLLAIAFGIGSFLGWLYGKLKNR